MKTHQLIYMEVQYCCNISHLSVCALLLQFLAHVRIVFHVNPAHLTLHSKSEVG